MHRKIEIYLCERDKKKIFNPGFEIKSRIKGSASPMQCKGRILTSSTLTWTQVFCNLEMFRGRPHAPSNPIVTDVSMKVCYTV